MNVYDHGFQDVLFAMLWAETDQTEENEPLDENYSINDITSYLKDELENKYKHFLEVAQTILPPDFEPDWEQFGHDFWLTCKGHGAGFWDRKELEYQNLGNQLTKVCEGIYLPDLYVTDDGKISGM
ncbi:hypothetical protein VP14_169 [Vibrio phage VPMCC14]|nr:hypothetical protein VP14_169 [Vibrio phage VPMCC14]